MATEIHRSLERFKVPKTIRKKTKGRTRLFRDKDELPNTSSLTDDITRALENSELLPEPQNTAVQQPPCPLRLPAA